MDDLEQEELEKWVKFLLTKDYTESDIIISSKNKNIVKVSTNRISFLSFIFFSLILIFSLKIIYLSLELI